MNSYTNMNSYVRRYKIPSNGNMHSYVRFPTVQDAYLYASMIFKQDVYLYASMIFKRDAYLYASTLILRRFNIGPSNIESSNDFGKI
jgi:hypothetical protein